ncbi:hypothetical protein [Falsiroseomonas sp. E2-1-a4]|uniref:hypothetical protein n=1 Tax=Falsiroseomonas sp. E2-1-a4 TaxID=3239299 RepID=UPI003F3D7D2C
MTRTLYVPALVGFLALGLVACDDNTSTSESQNVPAETRTGQSGGTVAPTAAGSGTTNSPGMSVPGASGTAPIGSASSLPPGTGSASGVTETPLLTPADPSGAANYGSTPGSTATGSPGVTRPGMGESGGGPQR